jgi:flagellar assembly protein FliH
MTATKFLFDNRFDLDDLPPMDEPTAASEEAEAPEPVEEAPPPPTFSEEEMAKAREEAFAEGMAEGFRKAAESTEARIAEGATLIGQRLAEMIKAQAQARDEDAREAVQVAQAIARKLFPELNRRHGLEEIESLVRQSLQRVRGEPQVLLSVHESLASPLSGRLEALALSAGFQGNVKVAGSAEVAAGDCRIAWSGGGADRDSETLWREIDAVIERNLAPATVGSAPANPAPGAS